MTDERNLSTADLAGTATDPTETRGKDPIPASMRDTGTDERTALFPGEEAESFRSRWDEIQTNFVDEPRSAVEQADSLVAQTMKKLADTFASERQNLESQWSRGEEASTEDLRVALQRYRSFFNRLLSV
jgi:hypothetical protein